MAKKKTKSQKKVTKVMREYKEGKLHSGSKKGPVVKNRKQAVAIALSEARKSKKKSAPKKAKKAKKKGDPSNGMWIQGAIKHPGALHKELHVKKGEKIPVSKLKAAAKKKGKEGKRARLAITLRKLNKRKK